VPLSWSEQKNVIWKTPLPGAGNSTPIVVGDRIFLTAASPKGEQRFVLCVRAGGGKVLWKRLASDGVPAGNTHVANGFASPSCATDGTRIYAFFGNPGLFCYDLDGRLLWHHFFGFFGDEPGWGTGASPVVVDELVIQNCDNDGPKGLPPAIPPDQAAPAALVALDKVIGHIRWSTPRNQGKGYGTPFLLPMAAGRVDLVLNSPLGVWGYDPHTGSERWHCTRTAPDNQAQRYGEPSPVSNGEMLYVASGRPGPNQGLVLPGNGDVTKTHVVWQGIRNGPRDVASLTRLIACSAAASFANGAEFSASSGACGGEVRCVDVTLDCTRARAFWMPELSAGVGCAADCTCVAGLGWARDLITFEQAFPIGFGSMAAELRGWIVPPNRTAE
jgi:hypothetical protein